MRGVAALVVLVSHCLLTVPDLSPPYTAASGPLSLIWWITFTPIHALWDGTAAVYVFFVLSGVVLCMPLVDRRVQLVWWASYYPRRLCRLYLPVVASILFALLTAAIVNRHASALASPWVNLHATTAHGVRAALHDSVLVFGATRLNSPLWSMRWEVIFSLTLPVYVVAARRPGAWQHKVLGLLVLVGLGEKLGSGVLLYLPMFAVGAVMAFGREHLVSLARRMPTPLWWALSATALLLLTSGWPVNALAAHAPALDHGAVLWQSLMVAGAATLVFIVSHWATARAVAESRPLQWLGRRSFSLYLIHEPILMAVVFGLGGHPAIGLTLAITVPSALLAADLFHRLVEGPSQRLSQLVGNRIVTAQSRPRPAAETSH